MRPASESIVLIGGGGHALVVLEAAMESRRAVRGFLDDDEHAVAWARAQLGRLGPMDHAERHLAFDPDSRYVLAVGGLELRRRLITQFAATPPSGGRTPVPAAAIVHPRAWVSPSAVLGLGVYVGPGAVVHAHARVADHAIINSGAIVEHECEIGENSHIAPGSVLGGNVQVGPDTLIGIGSCVLPRRVIGARACVGGGATVVHDIPGGLTVVGVPARPRD